MGRRPPLHPLLPICLSTLELGSLSCYSSFQFTWNSFSNFSQPSISLLLSGDHKESADDADPAEHHHHHDQGQGQTTLCDGNIISKSKVKSRSLHSDELEHTGKSGGSQRGSLSSRRAIEDSCKSTLMESTP